MQAPKNLAHALNRGNSPHSHTGLTNLNIKRPRGPYKEITSMSELPTQPDSPAPAQDQALARPKPIMLKPYRPDDTDRLFYDGGCGLCHKAVNFTLKYDPTGHAFRYTPLESELLDELLPPEHPRESLPDSVVVLTQRGEVLMKSDAALYLGMKMGGIWRALAHVGYAVPRGLRDVIYDMVARIRHRLFEKPKEACPLLPPELRSRFDY